MELMMPSLIAMLLAIAVAYFVVPKLAPNVLIVVSSIILAVAIYNHATRFGVTEYERATWTYKLKEYQGYIAFGVLLAVGYGFFFMKDQSPVGSPMPNLNMPVVGGGFGTVARTVRSRIGELMRKGRITLD